MAFLPIYSVRDTFRWLRTHPRFPRVLGDLYAYFFNTYIGFILIFIKKQFKVSMTKMLPIRWLCGTAGTIYSTNNAVEGWHNVFRGSFGSLNKTPMNFVKKLRKEEEAVRQKFLRIKSGESLYRKKCTFSWLKRSRIFYLMNLADYVYYWINGLPTLLPM